MLNKSKKKVLNLDEIILPYKIKMPIAGQVSVGSTFKEWVKGQEIILTFGEYEALKNSAYGKYIY